MTSQMPETQDKRKRVRIAWFRHAMQVFMVVLFCLPPIAAGWGLVGGFSGEETAVATPAEGIFYGSLSSSSIAGLTLLDPLAALEVIAASKAFIAGVLLGALPIVTFYGLLRGRAFCGWVCPVNLLGEIADALRRRLHIKVAEHTVPRHAKLWVAAGVVLLSAICSMPVFQVISPVGAISKGLAFGGFAGIFTLIAVLIADIFWSRRLWCRSLCPLGGIYEALGRLGQVNVRIQHDACIHCGACEQACLADSVILAPALRGDDAIVRAGDCMACGACVDACPTDALRMSFGRPHKSGKEQ